MLKKLFRAITALFDPAINYAGQTKGPTNHGARRPAKAGER